MLAQPKNRVQAIKSKFEKLNTENDVLVRKKSNQLNKQGVTHDRETKTGQCGFIGRGEESLSQEGKSNDEYDSLQCEWSIEPNTSYLYSVNDVKKNIGDGKTALTRQTSDPGKKLHRSHAFRCDRNIKISPGPKRHGSCNGRSETGDFTLKMGEKKLSKEKLKQLGSFLEIQMKKENFKPSADSAVIVGRVCHLNGNSLPDSQVPKHILDQYAKVTKAKKEEKLDSMTDSGVSSETENLDEIRCSKTDVAILLSENTENIVNLEKSEPDLESKSDLYASSETMRLERKNPHLKLTDTLKKALKQPLPPGPPPEKPPRIFAATSNESEKLKKDTKKMLEKLEEVLHKRESKKNIYDIVEEDDTSNPKEIHYLCTDILDVTQRSFVPLNDNVKTPISKCLNSLNCAIVGNSTLSLPYTKLSNADADPCSCSKENLMAHKCLSTFKDPGKCLKCQANELSDGFKCHVNCMCKETKSEFYVKEHIYYEPFEMSKSERHYGTLNVWKVDGASRSMEDLIINKTTDEKIYDEPCVTRPSDGTDNKTTTKTDFQKLIDSFEKPTSTKTSSAPHDKESTENVCDDYKVVKQAVSKIFATEPKRYKKNEKMRAGPDHLKRDFQVDVDRENLNQLMSEIYETVAAVCSMDENKPGSFPTETTDAASEESVRLTRSLTEKRKNYVRRVSSRVAYIEPKNVKNIRFRHETSVCSYKSDIDNPYSTFRSWKSFRNSQTNLSRDKMERTDSTDSKFNLTDSSGNILSMKGDICDESMDNLSIDEKLGCVDIDLPFEPREKGLFNFCVLVGLNYFTGQAYVKSVFPSQVQVPPHIENLVFPETLSPGSGSSGEWAAERNGQCYSLVLTDERGERAYGYCRRVLPEGATTCLPLCYCVIGKYRAPGFYYKILKEIESHHGNSEVEINRILQQLFETDFPGPGEEVTVAYRRPTSGREPAPDQCDIENNNHPKTDLSIRRQVIRRPIEPRADEDNMSTLLDELGAGLVIRVFGSLLLERKVVVVGDQLSTVSSCVEALQAALYPLVWQQPLVAAIPAEIHRDVLEAPLPILAGMLRTSALLDDVLFEEGMLIDLTSPNKVLFYQGDETTILPTPSYKTLKTSLQMESAKGRNGPDDTKTRNVMIAEAFLRFFVDILGDFWRFFSVGEVKEGDLGKNGVVFDKDNFIKSAKTKQVQFFLEWFTETAMFNHFIQNMAVSYHHLPSPPSEGLVDTPLPDYYELFHERVRSRSTKSENKLNDSKVNYKSAVNKKVKLLKTKLRDLVA